MGLRTWVKQQLGMAPLPDAVDLLGAPSISMPAPKWMGLDLSIPDRSWSVARLEALFWDAAQLPTPSSLQAARVARHRLSQFWLTAPVDQLEFLYVSPLGDLQRMLLEGPLPRQPLADDERQWRELLAERMVQPEQHSRLLNLLLALMPYTGPDKFKLSQAETLLPEWLVLDYATHCDPALKLRLEGPAGYLNPAAESVGEANGSGDPALQDFELPVLCQQRGEEALAVLSDAEVVRKIKALITLYGLAPDDQETLDELSGLRRVLAQLWLDVDASDLEDLFNTDVGEITSQLISSGFGAVLVNADDEMTRPQLKRCAEQLDVAEPDYQGLIFATLLYFPANKIEFDQVEGLPNWLVEALGHL
ncbi:hypothetical protein [Synechococcus sp. RS9902]|uniref:hypothetical protein n=1 Tax=Synechococcus sp. RS9902 TaxID=221345 RepID=UPI0016455833|nr:hypothetical protein [Synechococcus sp. RS9902]QNI96548.1 hypothetical protein SynRS9902_00646 [Synechococcus sp. RS9902]